MSFVASSARRPLRVLTGRRTNARSASESTTRFWHKKAMIKKRKRRKPPKRMKDGELSASFGYLSDNGADIYYTAAPVPIPAVWPTPSKTFRSTTARV